MDPNYEDFAEAAPQHSGEHSNPSELPHYDGSALGQEQLAQDIREHSLLLGSPSTLYPYQTESSHSHQNEADGSSLFQARPSVDSRSASPGSAVYTAGDALGHQSAPVHAEPLTFGLPSVPANFQGGQTPTDPKEHQAELDDRLKAEKINSENEEAARQEQLLKAESAQKEHEENVQLLSNMTRSEHESLMGIINNIR